MYIPPNSANVTGSAALTPAPSTTTHALTTPAPQALPEPTHIGRLGDDMIAEIVALMARSFRADRKEARKLNAIEEQNIVKEANAKVAAMRRKAAQIRSEGRAVGFSMMASGTLTATGASMSLGQVGGAETSGNWAQAGAGAGGMTEGLGKFAGSLHHSAQTDADGEIASRETASELAKRSADQYRAEEDDARRMLAKVSEFLKTIRDTQNATLQAAIYRA